MAAFIKTSPDSQSTAHHERPSVGAIFTGLKTLVFATEAVGTIFLALGHIDLGTALSLHFGYCAVLLGTILLAERSGIYSGDLQSFALQVLVAGPLGAASAMIDEQLSSHVRAERLQRWYDTIAPTPQAAVTLADRIRDDQVVRPAARLPKSVDRLIMSGSMREKQALFASIVADGPVEGAGLIEKALRSRDQRVRVQAAAVSALFRSKIRTSTGYRFKGGTAVPADQTPTPAA
ncbi:hypothetical protein OF122_04085 [Pelagibacterium flavum]|uniref:HEAT repeat domain-containing protein n=1 Tax=Pelagibacterium flavum TaxID=2984530 RepID=A0ABY6IU44_9HYPH|nr:hypothetical protein [Pelagibacterium sp. YIM 151497]UYQ72954.1 hypothetical protein OF122_04085 [Pelagibacterium sp. YIM 151497]|tara:strand:+ start:1658 stop:2359 length:702 start_codon:yes stop_codon:yes gene_type:complete|eukprot:jgi/Tetstr1/451613/TSEL_038649.t1